MKRLTLFLAAFLFASFARCAVAAMAVQVFAQSTTGLNVVPLTGVKSGTSYALLVTTSTGSVTGLDVWSQGTTIASSQVTVTGASATLLLASSTTRRAVTGMNTDATNAIWLGAVGVTTSTGQKVPAGATFTFDKAAGAAWYAIQSAGSPVITLLTESN